MSATARDTWSLEEDEIATVALDAAQAHDAYWEAAHQRENYFRSGLDYEDYAAAYCAGYVGQFQYGGDFAEAEKSVISNWVRMKGDSRLSLDEARMAMRAAWDRAAGVVPAQQEQKTPRRWTSYAQRFAQGAGAWINGGLSPRPVLRRQPASSAAS